jgi:hypothetical protein
MPQPIGLLMNVEDGKIVGIDVARKIAERLGVGLEVRDMKF